MPTTEELLALLDEPNETLNVEYKGWLDLTENHGRGVLAKAAMALANHGGGIVVLGMRARESEGPLESTARPAATAHCTPDAINAAINRFADPAFHCDLQFAVHRTSGVEHAFVMIPGGQRVPVICKRDCEGVLVIHRCYIRKPGPRSEEPTTAEEWRALFDRVMKAARADMLDAIRSIVQGNAGDEAPTEAPAGAALSEFVKRARARWGQLTRGLPGGDPAKFPAGHYELAFEILSPHGMDDLGQLRDALQQAGAIKHTGWGQFVMLSRRELAPAIIDNTIEVWLGRPEAERVGERDPAHSDFWRADARGHLVLLRGYDEDSHAEPGTVMDVTLPVWRVGEAILFVERLSESFGQGVSFLVRCRFTGLHGRRLVSINPSRILFGDSVAADNEVLLERVMTQAQARDNVTEVLRPMLAPLYERFSFFQLPERLVAEEIAKMTRNRF
ncbi:MAG: hypothetical protein HIU85_18725 [Proteobacteria bacterium]|nr:hypothetical protein [Pseudomonadota bacterium]